MSDFAEDTNVPTNDCISRQAAIDAISVYMKGYKEHIGKSSDSEVYAHARGLILSIESSINALPSAQPETEKHEYHYDHTGALGGAIRGIIRTTPTARFLSEEDYTELRDRFGSDVEYVVRDMISGKEERWK